AGTAAAVAAVTLAAAGATGAPRHVGIRTTAYVVKHTESALAAAAAADDIMETRATDGRQEFWLYQGPGSPGMPDSLFARVETFSGTGQPVTDIGTVLIQKSNVETAETSVSYAAKTWWRGQAEGTPPGPPLYIGTSCSSGPVTDQPAAIVTADIRGLLACGFLTDEGTQYVDGVDAIKLVSNKLFVAIVPGVKRPVRVTATVWVDPVSYLPVRWAQSWKGKVLSSSDLRWLSPTSANLAQLRVPIPAGFRQVPPPQG
ncbi:MAG: hypothetical protein ACRDOH_21635, partial [Streptosporangiaceae bacterium]